MEIIIKTLLHDYDDQAFKLFDADGDGKINGEELKALVNKVSDAGVMRLTMTTTTMMMMMMMKMTMMTTTTMITWR